MGFRHPQVRGKAVRVATIRRRAWILREAVVNLDTEYDVVVAGAGFSGLSAAMVLAEAGKKSLVLEAAPTPGGAAAISAGIIWAPETLEKLAGYVPDGERELQRAYCDTFPEAVDWLIGRGLPLSNPEPLGDLGVGTVMGPGRSGDRHVFMALMADAVEQQGGRVVYKCPLGTVERSPEGHDLVVSAGQGRTVRARALILATGGFQGSPELLDRYIGTGAGRRLMLRSVPECTGRGLLAAISLGAGTSRNLHNLYGHTMPDMAVPIDQLQPLTAYIARQSLILNRTGERFVDESEGRLEEVNLQDGWSQPGGVYYLFFDARVYREYGVDTGISPALPQLDRVARWQKDGACVFQAQTVEALLSQLAQREGMDAAGALRSIGEYNEACDHDRAASLMPPRCLDAFALHEPPFFAVRARGGVTATNGGIRIDASCRVLDFDGRRIPQLYACGVDAGGVFGRTYGGFLGWALASGVLAGRSAVADLASNGASLERS